MAYGEGRAGMMNERTVVMQQQTESIDYSPAADSRAWWIMDPPVSCPILSGLNPRRAHSPQLSRAVLWRRTELDEQITQRICMHCDLRLD